VLKTGKSIETFSNPDKKKFATFISFKRVFSEVSILFVITARKVAKLSTVMNMVTENLIS